MGDWCPRRWGQGLRPEDCFPTTYEDRVANGHCVEVSKAVTARFRRLGLNPGLAWDRRVAPN